MDYIWPYVDICGPYMAKHGPYMVHVWSIWAYMTIYDHMWPYMVIYITIYSPNKALAAEGFLLILYRITFAYQDLPSSGYLAQLPIACISGLLVVRVPRPGYLSLGP